MSEMEETIKQTLEELLGTDNKEEQVEKVQQLQRLVGAVPPVLTIRYSPIADMVDMSVMGMPMNYDLALHILDLAKRDLIKSQLAEEMEAEKKE